MVLYPEQRLKYTPPHHIVNFLKKPRVSLVPASSPGQLCSICFSITVAAMAVKGLWMTIETGQAGVFKDEQANKEKSVGSVVQGKNEKSNPSRTIIPSLPSP